MPARLTYTNNTQSGDLARQAGFIINDVNSGIDTAVIVSLFTSDDWWGDTFDVPSRTLGCKINSIVMTGKLTDAVLQKVRDEAEKALAWLIDDQVVETVTVDVVRYGDTGILLTVATSRRASETAIIELLWEAYADANI